jgi:hypothetical protein
MDTDTAARMLLQRVDEVGLVVTDRTRGWNHMGAVICDAALQPRCKYTRVVEPRVRRLIRSWPDADTVSRFHTRRQTSDIGRTLPWRGPVKLGVIRDLTDALRYARIETVADLRSALADGDGQPDLRTRLRAVHRIGPKTVDYLSILAGSSDHVAVDVHLWGFLASAGIPRLGYDQAAAIIKRAADMRGWRPGSLDAAIWDYMSSGP